MLRITGKVLKVDVDKTVRGAFGTEPALAVIVQRSPDREYGDYVKIPDTPENRKVVVPGYGFDSPVEASAGSYDGKAYVSLVANFRA